MKELKFDEYVHLFTHYVPKPEKVDKHTYRGRCPICGDSKKTKRKKRCYLMRATARKPTLIYCHNCGFKQAASYFFEEKTPEQFKKFQRPLSEKDLEDIKNLADGTTPFFYNEETIEEIKVEEYEEALRTEANKAKRALVKFFYEFTEPVYNNTEALLYLQSRYLSNDKIKDMLLLKPDFHDSKEFRFAYFRDYILIPFIDAKDDGAYYFHARRYRNLNNRFSRFLSCPYKPDEVDIDFFLNELRVTKSKPVLVAEGTMDALNLENAISTNGVKKITEVQIERFEHRFGGRDNIVYVLDNELVDTDARKKAIELLKQNKQVFLWSNLLKDFPTLKDRKDITDINKLCCVSKKFTLPTATILKYTSSNISALL